MNLSPLERYTQDLQRADFRRDSSQEHAVQCLQRLYEQLIADHEAQQVAGIQKI